MNPSLLESLVSRASALHLMGFTKKEIKPILESEQKMALLDAEVDQVWQQVQGKLKGFELDKDSADADLNLYLKRSDWIQSQLLVVFNNMLTNHNAMLEGKVEHDPEEDGLVKPVIPVKALDIAAMGEKIMKIDQERLAAKLSYPKSLQAATQLLASKEALSLPHETQSVLDSFSDMGETLDAEFSELDD